MKPNVVIAPIAAIIPVVPKTGFWLKKLTTWLTIPKAGKIKMYPIINSLIVFLYLLYCAYY